MRKILEEDKEVGKGESEKCGEKRKERKIQKETGREREKKRIS